MEREKFTRAIRKAIADRNAQSPEEREKIYSAARAALGRNTSNPALAETLDSAIADIEASYAPPLKEEIAPAAAEAVEPVAVPRRTGLLQRFAIFAVGIVLGAIGSAWLMSSLVPVASGTSEVGDVLDRKYRNELPHVPVAITFLRKVSDAVIARQKTDRAGLEAVAAKSFVPLKSVDPDLANQMPNTLPPGSGIVLRADGFNFKILFNWTLCSAVSMTNPNMVDPVRNKADVLGCPYFGVWTPGAAKW
jgi:hypothetical protein